MLKEIYTAAMGMIPQQTKLEVTANNIANANTTGFKREAVFERNLIDAKQNLNNVPGDVEQDDPPTGTYIDFSGGNFYQTDNPLDMALENQNGFFVLQDEAGNSFYSKAGHFKLSTDGTIQAMDGKNLMGLSGNLSLSGEFMRNESGINNAKALNLRITENGDLFINDTPIGTVQIAGIDNPETLKKVSDNAFVAGENTEVNNLPQEEVALRQGWLENSNVDVIKEMVSMIELQRAFEAGSKVIQANNETLDKSISLGRYY
ncbi:MAG: flagellar hook-basal body protein [Ignavibacteriae bacterium]|nr:flagellar hook-basal body protein [Ignavibacteriota bacterium]